MADVDVDRLLVLVQSLVVAHELQQLPPREDATRFRRQVAQDLELGGGQADALVTLNKRDFAGAGKHFGVPVLTPQEVLVGSAEGRFYGRA